MVKVFVFVALDDGNADPQLYPRLLGPGIVCQYEGNAITLSWLGRVLSPPEFTMYGHCRFSWKNADARNT
jgi:hypothetical protein